MSMPSIDLSRALSFGTVAEEYASWRPGYPDDAVEWLAPTAPARVADVGAGTGKLTSPLIGRGLVVDAVEPDPRMLAVLTQDNPTARPYQTASDVLPFGHASLDGYRSGNVVYDSSSSHDSGTMSSGSCPRWPTSARFSFSSRAS